MQIRLKEIMQEKGITSVALASMVGLSKNTISNLINNKTKPSLDTINEIAEKMNVPLWQLFASQEEVAGDSDFLAIIKYNGELKEVTSVGELEQIVNELKGEEAERKPIEHKNIRGSEYYK